MQCEFQKIEGIAKSENASGANDKNVPAVDTGLTKASSNECVGHGSTISDYGSKDNFIKEYIKNILPKLRLDLVKDVSMEEDFVLKGKIELHLLSMLSSSKIGEIFPYAKKDKENLFIDLRIHNSFLKIAIESFESDNYDLRERVLDYEILENYPGLIKSKMVGKSIYSNNTILKRIGKYPIFSRKEVIDNFDFYHKLFYKRTLIDASTTSRFNYEYGDVIDLSFPGYRSKKTLFQLYMEANNVSEEYALIKLSNFFKLLPGLFSPVNIDRRSRWMRSLYKRSHSADFNFKDACNREYFSAVIRIDDKNSKYCVLPETLWINIKKSICRRYINVPPEGLLSLINKENDFQSSGYAGGSKIIILTDSLLIVKDRNDPEFTWTSWYGGGDAVGRVDWDMLTGKLVYYLVVRHSGMKIKSVYSTALSVYRQISKVHKICVRYIIVDNIPGANKSDVEIIDDKDFLKKAMSIFEICVPNSNEADKEAMPAVEISSAAEMSSFSPTQYLLYPAIPDNTTTLLHSRDPGNASWLTLGMAYAVAVGKGFVSVDKGESPDNNKNNVSDNVCVNNKYVWMNGNQPRKVLYIYSESKMEYGCFSSRLCKIKKIFGSDNDAFFINAMIKTVSYNQSLSYWLNLTEQLLESAKNDKRLNGTPVSLLVIDDYDMFGDERHKETFWNELLARMNTINKSGCSVLLLHPEKRHKAKAIKLQSVFEANAENHDDGSIAFAIRLEKCRDQDEKLRRLPDLEFNPLDSKPCWRRATLKFSSVEERDDKIIELMKAKGKRGQPRNVKEIAELFGISRVRIHQIMKKMKPIK